MEKTKELEILTNQANEIKQLKAEIAEIKQINEEINKKSKANYMMVIVILSLTILSIMLHFLF